MIATPIDTAVMSVDTSRAPTLVGEEASDHLQAIDFEKPPDGGRDAWLAVLGMHITVFNTWGFINSYGVFQAYYESNLMISASAISWIGSIQIFLLFSLGTFTGRAFDAGYFRSIYTAGTILLLIGVFTTSFATNYWQLFLSQGLCNGVANGLLFCPTISLCSTYFQKRRNWALGIGAAGSATGGIIIPVLCQQLLPKIGFAWTIRVVGIVCLVTMVIANLILKPRLPPRKTGSLVEWAAFKDTAYVLFAVGMFLQFWGVYFAFYYISTYSRNVLKMSQEDSFNMVMIMNGVGLFGRLIPNNLADTHTGPLNLLVPFGGIVGLLFFAWIAVKSYTGLIIWVCFYGFFAAGIQSLFPATLSSLTTDMSKAGTRMGMIFTIVSFACLTGTPIGGALVEYADGDYWVAQVFAGVAVVLGAGILAASRVAKTGWGWRIRA